MIHVIIDVGYALEFDNLADVSDKWNPVIASWLMYHV